MNDFNTIVISAALFIVLPVIVLLARGVLFQRLSEEQNLFRILMESGFPQDLAVMGFSISACSVVLPSNGILSVYRAIAIGALVSNMLVLGITPHLRLMSTRLMLPLYAYLFAATAIIMIILRLR